MPPGLCYIPFVRILFLTPQLPYPPRQGTAMRNWGLLSGVARRHDVWLLSFDDRPDAGDRIPEALSQACAGVAAFPVPGRGGLARLKTLATSGLPDMAWRLWSPDFAAQFAAWRDQHAFDVVQVEGIELARYVLDPPLAAGRAPKVVFDDHNCEYLLQRRAFETDLRNPSRLHAAAYSFAQWRRLREFERRACDAADAVLCVSPQDAAHLQALDPAIRPTVVFNGIDVEAYAAGQNNHAAPPGPPSLVFTGKMDFRPNIDAMLWFGLEVFPRIKRAVPATRLYIVGQQPHARLDVLRSDPNITITGAVDDVRPHIERAQVYIAPLRVGGGTRFKLLEAMALRKAIVTTTLGCEGFDVAHGDHMLIADTADAFAAAVIQALRDPGLRARLGAAANDFVRRTYDWSAIVPVLDRVYQGLAEGGAAP